MSETVKTLHVVLSSDVKKCLTQTQVVENKPVRVWKLTGKVRC